MPHRTRAARSAPRAAAARSSARVAASVLSALVAVLAFVVPSRVATAQVWAAPSAHRSAADQVTTVRGPEAPGTPHAVRATAPHHHAAPLPQPPFPAPPHADRAPHGHPGGPAARLSHPALAAQHAQPAPRPRGPPTPGSNDSRTGAA
ncbi:hypothetical protein [Streptomyces sp. G45]|uniref:hypothetical protein n=1 Tax=Streptomyces sp. G45 TaxID=3406627 RepID=UPI003C271E0E